jgi:DNA-directed RNA polymerase specialized sigma24 family protein
VNGLSPEEAYRKWGDDLLGYATALVGPTDSSDVVAEAFVRVLADEQGGWRRVIEPRGYLFRIVLNVARERARSAGRRRQREIRWTGYPAPVELLADHRVADMLSRLSVRQRSATYLTYWEDLDLASVADLMGISVGAVTRHLNRARRSLRTAIEEGVDHA